MIIPSSYHLYLLSYVGLNQIRFKGSSFLSQPHGAPSSSYLVDYILNISKPFHTCNKKSRDRSLDLNFTYLRLITPST